MKKNYFKKPIFFVITIILTLGLSISFQSLLAAWTAPTVAPPGGGLPVLLNEGSLSQVKSGGLGVNGNFLADTNTLFVNSVNNRVGIGTTNPSEKLDIVGNLELNGSIICSGCVDATDLANNSVGTAQVVDNSLTANDLADYVEGAQSRCGSGLFLNGDGICRSAGQIVTDGLATTNCVVPSNSTYTCWPASGSVIGNMRLGLCECTWPLNGGGGQFQCVNGVITKIGGGVIMPCARNSCFTGGTLVIMADGSNKRIEDVVIGDRLASEDGFNTVIDYDRPYLTYEKDQRLIAINGSDFFMTDNHPVKTKDGWKAYYPESAETEAWDILHGNIAQLQIGDRIIAEGGNEIIVESIKIKEKDKEPRKLYNFVLDGDSTYYANGMLVMGFVPDKAGRFPIEHEH